MIRTWEKVPGTPCPAIVKRTDGRYTVLAKIDGDKVLIQDPLQGRLVILSREQFELSWTGEVLLFTKRANLRVQDLPFDFTWFIPSLVKYRRFLGKAQVARIKATELTYSSITGERLPSLVAQGDYGLVGNRWNNALDTYNMAVLLQIPIFDGAQREGRIAEARSQLRQESLRTRSVLNQVKMEVHDAIAALNAANEQLAIAQQGMDSASRELSLAKERYAVITAASNFELTSALYSVSRAKENLINALFELNASRVNVARSTGRLECLS